MERSKKVKSRFKRKTRIRKKVIGRADRPRLSVFRSLKNIYAQVIDDDKGSTLVGISSLNKDIRKKKLTGLKQANTIGEILAEKCKEKKIKKVVFDKNGFKYHGRIKALAESARKSGLEF